VAAGENEFQAFVGKITVLVTPAGSLFCLRLRFYRLSQWLQAAIAPLAIDSAPASRRGQPGRRLVRYAIGGPTLPSREQRILQTIFRELEISHQRHQPAEDPRALVLLHLGDGGADDGSLSGNGRSGCRRHLVSGRHR
jgi:hypothetical protein